jgi:hypothetical protein
VAIITPTWAVDGNGTNGQLWRVMHEASMAEQQGIVDALDLTVTQTTPATSGILINPGAFTIWGQEFAGQGNYSGYNQGQDNSLSIAATGGVGRNDLIVVRAEDPTWAGSPWAGSAANQICFFRDISGVSAGTSIPPTGISAIPLALLTIPANTSIITSSMITDVRQVARPARQRQMLSLPGSTWSTSSPSPIESGPTQWPNPGTWTVYCPTWATYAYCSYVISGLLFTVGGSGNEGTSLQVAPDIIGSGSVGSPQASGPSSTLTVPSTGSATAPYTIAGNGLMFLPAAIRGTTQTITWVATGLSGFTGQVTATALTQIMLDFEFVQLNSLT